MTLNEKIFGLMEVKEEEHDINWLKESLQAAIEVEFFTIPVYLSALWSIKDLTHFAYQSIRIIVVDEEMLHFGLICNLLTALGEVPKLNVREHVPTYPNPLPGNINPKLMVSLQGLSTESLDTYMAIEYPEGGSVVEETVESMAASMEEFSTIGAFYTAILQAFENLQPALSAVNQQERASFGLFKITDLDGVRLAIEKIKRQGEGSAGSPEDTGVDDLAHFYRFGEIRFGKRLKKNPTTGKWKFDGDDIGFPEVFPMATVPAGGYLRENVSDEVWTSLETFDRNYSNMLNRLQAAWQGGSLGSAVGAMFSLEQSAVALMNEPIPDGDGNYGPCFRLV